MPAVERRKCKRCGDNRDVRFFVGTRGRICADCRGATRSVGTKDQRLQETYNITYAEWQAILDAQGGVCAICGGKRVFKTRPQYDTDHDHKLEKQGVPIRECLRGLLCKRCNRRLLPASLDSIEILLRAIDYLQHGLERTQAVLFAATQEQAA